MRSASTTQPPPSARAPRRISQTTIRTDETIGPAQLFEVAHTRLIVWEHPNELAVGLRVVVARDQSLGFYAWIARRLHHNILYQVALTVHLINLIA